MGKGFGAMDSMAVAFLILTVKMEKWEARAWSCLGFFRLSDFLKSFIINVLFLPVYLVVTPIYMIRYFWRRKCSRT